MKFYYRRDELEILNTTYAQTNESARRIVLTGRRRVGKTMLALKHVEDKPHVYFFVAKKTEALLCEELIKQLKSIYHATPTSLNPCF